jgi:hypothetical protein
MQYEFVFSENFKDLEFNVKVTKESNLHGTLVRKNNIMIIGSDLALITTIF